MSEPIGNAYLTPCHRCGNPARGCYGGLCEDCYVERGNPLDWNLDCIPVAHPVTIVAEVDDEWD